MLYSIKEKNIDLSFNLFLFLYKIISFVLPLSRIIDIMNNMIYLIFITSFRMINQ